MPPSPPGWSIDRYGMKNDGREQKTRGWKIGRGTNGSRDDS